MTAVDVVLLLVGAGCVWLIYRAVVPWWRVSGRDLDGLGPGDVPRSMWLFARLLLGVVILAKIVATFWQFGFGS